MWEATVEVLDSGAQLTPREWEELLRHAERRIRRGLTRMGFAQELVEEALLSAVLKIVEKQASGSDVRRESILAYLWRITYNCAIDMKRKTRREQPLESPVAADEEPAEFPSAQPDPERQAILRSDVNRCLDKLPQMERAIVLHKSYGLTAKEIKELLGIQSEASVNTRYSAACKLLRQCLDSSSIQAARAGQA
jgi:RNA polymerase sigma factor (sigma-70 family)